MLTATPGYYPCLRRPPASARLAWAVRWRTVFSLSEKKRKELLKSAIYGTHVQHGGVKEKKRKEKRREKLEDKNENRTYDSAFIRQALASTTPYSRAAELSEYFFPAPLDIFQYFFFMASA